jgi:hypothetical protein
MPKPQGFTVSIIGACLLVGIPAGLFAWLGPFFAPNLMPFRPGTEWSSAQFHGFAIATGAGVGICTAAALVVVRSILPLRLRSRIVWLPPRMLDRTLLKRQSVELLAVVAITCVMVLFVRGCPLDRAKLIGRTSEEVRAAYGQPDFIIDHRADHPAVEEIYWHYKHGLLGESQVTLKKGVVVNVSYRVGK